MRAARLADAVAKPVSDRKGGGDEVRVVDGRELRFTNLDRVLWPEAGFTKRDLARYYLAIAPRILPHLEGRALTVGRFPSGIDARGFAQAEVPGRPDWIRAVRLPLANGDVKAFTLVDDRAGLAWLAQMGTVEIHTFLARADALETPSSIVFDLDPGEPASVLEAAEVALLLRDRLASEGLCSFAKTSGSVGMHVVVPLNVPGVTYEATRELAQRIARELARARADLVVEKMDRSARIGKVLVDARQNSRRLTMAVPWSLRSTPRPTVSMPVTWDEVARGELYFEAEDAIRREGEDPFAPVLTLRQSLTPQLTLF